MHKALGKDHDDKAVGKKHYDKAMDLYTQALKTKENAELCTPLSVGITQWNIGGLLELEGQVDDARRWYEKAGRKFEEALHDGFITLCREKLDSLKVVPER